MNSGNEFATWIIYIYLYVPISGRSWHLALAGCLRVIEPFLSPHRYK